MLAFYGFEWNRERIVKSAAFPQRSRNWLSRENHNHLRITRILRSLYVLGEMQAARALFDALLAIYDETARSDRGRISERSFEFWKRAIEL